MRAEASFTIKHGLEHHLTEAAFRYLVLYICMYIWRALAFPLHAHRPYGNLYNEHNIGHTKSVCTSFRLDIRTSSRWTRNVVTCTSSSTGLCVTWTHCSTVCRGQLKCTEISTSGYYSEPVICHECDDRPESAVDRSWNARETAKYQPSTSCRHKLECLDISLSSRVLNTVQTFLWWQFTSWHL